ncbi:MAG: asparaginase [Proteobacteria bacterium]|nr:asparaginase [Pseudomonadota bacterium]
MAHIVCTRGGHLESVHPFSAVAVQDGQIIERIGPSWTTTMRSAAKPFQLACSLEALGDPDCSDAELAVGSASHAGEQVHVDLVRKLLGRFGVLESQLACGGHAPLWAGAHDALVRGGGHISDIHNNCSGKHTFMLAACRAQGWDGDYRDPDHPLQQRIRVGMTAWSGVAPAHGTDGCGVPSWVLPIEAMGLAWARIAEGEGRLGRIGRAMEAHPELTSGTGRLDAAVMAGKQERMIVKIGAQALFCMAFPERRTGVVVKLHTGVSDVLGPAIEHVVDAWLPGAWSRPDDWDQHRVRNVRGVPVGEKAVQA